MKNKNFKKIICAGLALVLAASLGLTGSLLVRSEESWADEKSGIDSAVSSVTGALSKENTPISLGDGETMYVIQNADGSVSKAIASESGEFTTQDLTTYTQPVDVAITYFLDGEEISASDLAGKSGKVTIRFNYTNNEFKDDLYVPYLAVSGLILDDEIFSNVTVTHGRAIDDGNRTIAGGIALPGMKYNLDPNGTIEDVQKIPDYVEINADVTNFSLSMTISLVMPIDFSQISLSSFDGLDTIGSDMDTLVAAVDQLCSGAEELAEGTDNLASGAGSLATGASSLSSGLGTISSNSSSLRDGSKAVFESLLATAQSQLEAAGLTVPSLTISNYDEELQKIIDSLDPDVVYAQVKAAVTQTVTEQVKATVTSQVQETVISQAGIPGVTTWTEYQQAVAGEFVPEMVQTTIQTTVDNNVETQMESEAIKATITGYVEAGMQGEEAQTKIAAAAAGSEKVVEAKAQLDSYNTFYQGLGTYTGGTDQAAIGAADLSSGANSLSSGAKQINDGAAQISDGLNQLNEEGISKLTSIFGDDLANALSRFSKVIDLGKEASNTKYIMRSAAIK